MQAKNAIAENVFIISEHDVRMAFRGAGPDGITGQVFRDCAYQLAPVFTKKFNVSQEHSVIYMDFKQSIIVPV